MKRLTCLSCGQDLTALDADDEDCNACMDYMPSEVCPSCGNWSEGGRVCAYCVKGERDE